MSEGVITGAPTVVPTLTRVLSQLAVAAAEDELGEEEWEDAFDEALAQYHLAAYAHGAGVPIARLTPKERDLIQDVIDRQKEFVKGFKEAFLQGRYAGRPEVAARRAQMYADATLGTWWMGHTRGWVLPAYPGDGTTQCKTKCRCRWRIDVLPGEGNADAHWLLGSADHCQTCMQRSEDWGPVQIRNGELQL